MTKLKQHIQSDTDSQLDGWIRYQPDFGILPDDERWLGLLGLRSFRLLLWAAIFALSALIVRNLLLRGTIPWADAGTVVTISFVLWLISRKPEWFTPLSWTILAVLFLDVLDGLSPWSKPITPTHLLMPILVLYGALLCDIAITVAAALGVLGLCALTWLEFTPLSISDKMMLSNIVLATLISGATALGIWLHNKRLMRDFRQQAERLRIELETNNRLNAVIFHDISNPLTALNGKIELAQLTGKIETFDLSLMDKMVGHINSIIQMARAINSNLIDTALRESVTTDRMAEDLLEIFSGRLALKKQTFSFNSGAGLQVKTIYDILLNSILSNLVSNAIKFSPQGSIIEMRAACEGKNLRIEICDQGGGFPAELLKQGGRRVNISSLGTAGETGYGLGLDIVALYVAKIGGILEIMNRPDGGGTASVVLPIENS